MRRKRRTSVDLGMIFAAVAGKQIKKIRLTDFYKSIGLEYHGDFDGIWTIGPDGKAINFETIPYTPKYDYISKAEEKGFINYTEDMKDAFIGTKDYLEQVMCDWGK